MASPLLLFFGALMMLAPSAALPVSWAANGSAAPTEVVLAAMLPKHDPGYLWAWPRVGPALDLALEALEPPLRHAGLAVRPVFAPADKNGSCSLAGWNALKLIGSQAQRLDVLLGFGCDYKEALVTTRSLQSKLPLLLAGDYQGAPVHWTVVYAGPAGADLGIFLRQLEQRFNWTTRAVFAFSRGKARDLPRYYSKLSAEVEREGSRTFRGLDEQPGEALRFIRNHSRVAYLQGSPETLLQTMRLAQAQNMTHGDYVFIYLDLLGESLEAVGHREAAKPWQSKEGRDEGGLREAFQTVLIITAHQPQTPEYRRFQSELILRAQRDFGVALNDSLHKNLVAGCFHDVLLLYIRALNETLHEGGTQRDTRDILGKMRDLKIQGVTGMMSLNKNNEREMDFDLWSMADVDSGQYQLVGHYLGSEERIQCVGPIHWKKGCPPFNDPPCVFNMDYPSCDEGVLENESIG